MRWSSGAIVPDRTRNSERWPTYGSAMVWNTKASGSPSGRRTPPRRSVPPAVHRRGPVDGRRADLDEVVGQAVDADVGVAEPHSTGNSRCCSISTVRACSSSVDRRHVVGEEPLEQGVVAGDDPLDHLVVDPVLELGELVGDGAPWVAVPPS